MIQPFQVVLLAGGKGQGLYPLTSNFPKSLLPVGNKPLIAYQLEYLEKYGFEEVIIVLRPSSSLKKYLENYKGKMKLETKEINEDVVSNVDALKLIKNKINRNFIVIPCDLISDIDLDSVLDQHLMTGALCTVVLKENEIINLKTDKKKESKNEDVEDYDVVILDEQSKRILQIKNNYDFSEKISLKKPILLHHPELKIRTDLVDCHLYIFDKQILHFLKNTNRRIGELKDDFLPFIVDNQYNAKFNEELYADEEGLEEEKFPGNPKIEKKFASIYAYLLSSNIYCKRITEIADFMKVNQDIFVKPLPECLIFTKNNSIIEKKEGEDEIKEKKEKKPTDFLMGENTSIGEKIMISKSIVGKNCKIGDNVKISKSVIFNNVIIENDCVIQDSVLSAGSQIKSKSKLKDALLESNAEHFVGAKSVSEFAYFDDMNSSARMTMEDDHFAIDDILKDGKSGFFGVLDGHNGEDVVKHCTKAIPEMFMNYYSDYENDLKMLFKVIFQKTDDQLRLIGASDSGACVCVCLILQESNKKACYIANLGDTRAVLVRNSEAIRLSFDHKASNEQEADRVRKIGGIIAKNRVSGSLAVTRTLGDLELKSAGVSNDPYVNKINITSDDKYLIIASDGLWDVVEDNKLVELVKDTKNSEEVTKKLVKHALSSGSRDNIGVLALKF